MIREVWAQDIAALAQLARDTFIETFGHLYTAGDLETHLANKCSAAFFTDASQDENTRLVLAWEGDAPVGYAKWGALELPVPDPAPDACEIHRLYVKATHQRGGIGRLLLEHMLKDCAGASEIYLGVWEHNEKAQALYGRYGFTYAGEHTYYVGAHADRDLIWRKTA